MEWGHTPESGENHGGRSGGILQATGKLTAGRGGILQENRRTECGGSAGKFRETGLCAEWGDTLQRRNGGHSRKIQKLGCGRGDT